MTDAIPNASAIGLVKRPVTTDDVDMRRLAHVLYRSLASDGIPDDLIAAIDYVLRDRPALASDHGRRLDCLLVRIGLPLPRRRRPQTAPLSQEDVAWITNRFRRATRLLVQVAPYRTAMYPTEEISRLLALRKEQAAPCETLSYLRRYARAIVDLLDLMGDDPE